MQHSVWTVSLFIGLMVGMTPAPGIASGSQPPETIYERAVRLTYAVQYDSVRLLLEPLLADLEARGQEGSALALRSRLLLIRTGLEVDGDHATMVADLLSILDDCKRYGHPDIAAEAYILRALLHEASDNERACRDNLNAAEDLIDAEGLDTLRPLWAVRFSSYYRVFGKPDSAMIYARMAVDLGHRYGILHEEADGYLLMSILFTDRDWKRSADYIREAGKRYFQLGKYTSYASHFARLANLHLKNGFPEKALALNDSCRYYERIAMVGQQRYPPAVYTRLRQRAEIYHTLGNLDSAYHYQQRAHRREIDYLQEGLAARIASVEGKYADEQKTQQLAEQARLIAEGRKTRNRVLGIAGLLCLFAVLLSYLYFRLRKAKRTTERQTRFIRKTNADLQLALQRQIVLQGEVHHRVKNNLQVIISLIELQKEDIEDRQARASLEAMSGRIYSMAAIHEILHRKEGTQRVDLAEYVGNLCNHFGNLAGGLYRPRFDLAIDAPSFNLETLMPLGTLLNELLTNSLKYATVAGRELHITIRLNAVDNGYRLYYRDNGPGFPTGKLRERPGGLGTYLLRSMVRQLRGRLKTSNDNGAVFEIFFLEKDVGGLQPLNVNEIES